MQCLTDITITVQDGNLYVDRCISLYGYMDTLQDIYLDFSEGIVLSVSCPYQCR